MTYFVAAELPWRAWMIEANRDGIKLVREDQFAEAVQKLIPGTEIHHRRVLTDGGIRSVRLITGVRYYEDERGGRLLFGV
jgi:hypothetical protein